MQLTDMQTEAILAVVLAPLVFSLYLISARSGMIRKLAGSADPSGSSSIRLVMLQKITGALIFIVIPLLTIIFFSSKAVVFYGIRSPHLVKDFLYAAPFAVVIIPLNIYNSKTEGNLRLYPQFRLKEWTLNHVLLTTFTWTIYLVGYEFLFRGYLLFSCLEYFTIPVSIIINVVLYSLVHIHKGYKESLGAIPMGIILCLLVIRLGSIWPAVFLHLLLALSNEYLSILAHPGMVFSRRKGRIT